MDLVSFVFVFLSLCSMCYDAKLSGPVFAILKTQVCLAEGYLLSKLLVKVTDLTFFFFLVSG